MSITNISSAYRRAPLAAAVALLAGAIAAPASAVVLVDQPDGIKATMHGSIPVYFSYLSGKNGGEDGSRITSSFNPANVTFGVVAPETHGLTVSGTFQIDSHLGSPSLTQNDNGNFESRVAELTVSGDFGAVSAGKGFGIFNSNAIGDVGSAKGIGRVFSGADFGGATGGRIGAGYVYANFNPHVVYATPDMGGLSAKIGVINPEEPNKAGSGRTYQTKLPRVEGQVTYAADMNGGSFKIWSGFLHQKIDVVSSGDYSYNLEGYDVGAHLGAGGFGLTANYTKTKGIGADGLYGNTINDAEVNGSQWYVEPTFTVGKTTLGVSYGEGSQDARGAIAKASIGAAPAVTNKLSMAFVRYQLTSYLTLMGEYSKFETDPTTSEPNYDLVGVGAQLDF